MGATGGGASGGAFMGGRKSAALAVWTAPMASAPAAAISNALIASPCVGPIHTFPLALCRMQVVLRALIRKKCRNVGSSCRNVATYTREIGGAERIARYLHFDAGARRDAQKLVPVFAREIGDGNELAFLPQKPIRETRNIGHVDAAAYYAAALLHRRERRWH